MVEFVLTTLLYFRILSCFLVCQSGREKYTNATMKHSVEASNISCHVLRQFLMAAVTILLMRV